MKSSSKCWTMFMIFSSCDNLWIFLWNPSKLVGGFTSWNKRFATIDKSEFIFITKIRYVIVIQWQQDNMDIGHFSKWNQQKNSFFGDWVSKSSKSTILSFISNVFTLSDRQFRHWDKVPLGLNFFRLNERICVYSHNQK